MWGEKVQLCNTYGILYYKLDLNSIGGFSFFEDRELNASLTCKLDTVC